MQTATVEEISSSDNETKLHPVALTALISLTEVLLDERYEEAADAIAIAFEFGATHEEVESLLATDVKMIRDLFFNQEGAYTPNERRVA